MHLHLRSHATHFTHKSRCKPSLLLSVASTMDPVYTVRTVKEKTRKTNIKILSAEKSTAALRAVVSQIGRA